MRKAFEPMETLDQDRKFALQLHALHVDDRAWVLSQLSVAMQAHFKSMLDELEALGLQIAAEDIPAILASTSSFADTADTDKANTPTAAIHRASSAQINFLFEDEPPVFLASLKSLTAWPWSADKTDSDQRKYIASDFAAVPALTTATQAALLAAVAARLPDSTPPNSGTIKQALATPLLTELFKKVFRWGR